MVRAFACWFAIVTLATVVTVEAADCNMLVLTQCQKDAVSNITEYAKDALKNKAELCLTLDTYEACVNTNAIGCAAPVKILWTKAVTEMKATSNNNYGYDCSTVTKATSTTPATPQASSGSCGSACEKMGSGSDKVSGSSSLQAMICQWVLGALCCTCCIVAGIGGALAATKGKKRAPREYEYEEPEEPPVIEEPPPVFEQPPPEVQAQPMTDTIPLLEASSVSYPSYYTQAPMSYYVQAAEQPSYYYAQQPATTAVEYSYAQPSQYMTTSYASPTYATTGYTTGAAYTYA